MRKKIYLNLKNLKYLQYEFYKFMNKNPKKIAYKPYLTL